MDLNKSIVDERSWIQKAFESAPMDADEEKDRHPRFISRYMGRPVREREYYGYRVRDTMIDEFRGLTFKNGSLLVSYDLDAGKEPEKELETGDTATLDDFLEGFKH